MSGKLLLIYIRNFHVLSHFLLIYICKLHWGRVVRKSFEERFLRWKEIFLKWKNLKEKFLRCLLTYLQAGSTVDIIMTNMSYVCSAMQASTVSVSASSQEQSESTCSVLTPEALHHFLWEFIHFISHEKSLVITLWSIVVSRSFHIHIYYMYVL